MEFRLNHAILASHCCQESRRDADVSSFGIEIDLLVYSLYGLTREEIAIIEERLQEKTGCAAGAHDAAVEPES